MTPQSTQTDESRAVIAFRVIVGCMVITAMLAGVAPFTATETVSAQNGTDTIYVVENSPSRLVAVDRATMTETANVSLGTGSAQSVDHTDSRIYVTVGDEIRVFDHSLTQIDSVQVDYDPGSILAHQSGYVWTVSRDTVDVVQYDSNLTEQSRYTAPDLPLDTLASSNDHIFANTGGGGLHKFDARTGDLVATGGASSSAYSLSYSGGYVFGGYDEVWRVDAATLDQTASVSLSAGGGVGVAADNGSVYASGNTDGDRFRRFDTDLNEVARNDPEAQGRPRMELYNNELYTASGDLRVYDPADLTRTDRYTSSAGGSVGDLSVEATPEVTYPVDVTTQYQNGTTIADADVTITDDSDDSTVTSGQTDSSGVFSTSLPDGSYVAEATKTNHTVDTASFSASGSGESITLTLQEIGAETELQLNVDRWMPHNSTQPYVVTFTNETGQRSNVTTQADVTSDNTSVVTVDSVNYELDATGNESIAARANITANYTSNGVDYTATDYVAVANVTTSNLKVLPPAQRLQGTVTDDTIYVIIIAAMLSVAATRFSSAFGGLSMGTMTMVVGYLGGYVGEGIAMLSLFTALFIGLNLAANIDYTVRR